jgi:Protein of unknown function (DUF3606)
MTADLEGGAMSHDLASFKPLDPGRVNAIDAVELRYWCRELKCTETQLSEAIARVGEHVTEIREALASPPRHR